MAIKLVGLREEEDRLFYDRVEEILDLIHKIPLERSELPEIYADRPEVAVRREYGDQALDAIMQVFAITFNAMPTDCIPFSAYDFLMKRHHGQVSDYQFNDSIDHHFAQARKAIANERNPGSFPCFLSEIISATTSGKKRQLIKAWEDVIQSIGLLHLPGAALAAVKTGLSMREAFSRHAQGFVANPQPQNETANASAFRTAYCRGDITVQTIGQKLEGLNLPETIQQAAVKELERISGMTSINTEYHLVLSYLERIADLPWAVPEAPEIDFSTVRQVMDEDHYGMERAKTAIINQLAVQILSRRPSGNVICLAGAPGIGKTSLGRSIAKATGRAFQKIALGGVSDESSIRGHRRTYTNSMPGQIMEAVRKAGTTYAVLMMDEIDKLGAGGPQGDPGAALLEVLDHEQNNAFTDHYFGVPYDLSNVLFICTANDVDAIPGPLRNRMEIIDLDGYTRSQKRHIANTHLIPKIMRESGLSPEQVRIDDSAVTDLIQYFSEPGVRKTDKALRGILSHAAAEILSGKSKIIISAENLGSYFQKPSDYSHYILASEPTIGVVNGLTASANGGGILPIESIVMDGQNFGITATGNLKTVIQESFNVVRSWILKHGKEFGQPQQELHKKQVHIHAGTTPKDGPSAGIAALTSIVSALTEIPVRHDIAMTGEVGLRGQVGAIGGLEQKLEAAALAGIKTVIVPKANQQDVEKMPEDFREELGLEIRYVRTIREVLDIALTRSPWQGLSPAFAGAAEGPAEHPTAQPSVQRVPQAAMCVPG